MTWNECSLLSCGLIFFGVIAVNWHPKIHFTACSVFIYVWVTRQKSWDKLNKWRFGFISLWFFLLSRFGAFTHCRKHWFKIWTATIYLFSYENEGILLPHWWEITNNLIKNNNNHNQFCVLRLDYRKCGCHRSTSSPSSSLVCAAADVFWCASDLNVWIRKKPFQNWFGTHITPPPLFCVCIFGFVRFCRRRRCH